MIAELYDQDVLMFYVCILKRCFGFLRQDLCDVRSYRLGLQDSCYTNLLITCVYFIKDYIS